MTVDIKDVLRNYLGAALWSSTDGEGTPLDYAFNETDIAAEIRDAAHNDCAAFVEQAEALGLLQDMEADRIGHDFWLTRNHHGAGFWDRNMGQRGADLTTLAQSFGSIDLYVGDDNKIYAQ